MDPLAVNVREACRLTSLSRTTIYKLLTAGQLSAVKAGRRTLILVASIRHLALENLSDLAKPSCNAIQCSKCHPAHTTSSHLGDQIDVSQPLFSAETRK